MLFAAVAFLLLFGLTVIYGLSINAVAGRNAFTKQLIFALIGIAIFIYVSGTNYRFWQTYSKVFYVAGLLALIGTLAIGTTIRGTTGWINIAGFSFQPVEFAKIALVVFLSKYFSEYAKQFFLWRHIIISGLAAGAYVCLVLLQPDLGSAMVMVGTWFLLLLVVGIRRGHLATLIVAFGIVALLSWSFVLQGYQKDRLLTFINPQKDVLGVGYNVRQSIIAVGAGQFWGRGFALGSQSQLKFLPEPETDFIFAVLAEEFGFVGSLLLVAGLLFILYRLVLIAHRTNDNFAAYFCLSLASLMTVQSFINIGMNLGIAPVTGIPLPFISAGGSSLVSMLLACGIASSIYSDIRRLSGN